MLEATGVSHAFGAGAPVLRGVSLDIAPGEMVGLSGPSGSGKTTLGRILAGRLQPASGAVRLDGLPLSPRGFCPVQYLAQHPVLDMNPRWRAGRIIAEAGAPDSVLSERLGVEPSWLSRFPHELSGGQLQRLSILRALRPETRYLVADEITAPLDPIAQGTIWRILLSIAEERGIGILAISHDAALLERIAVRRVALAR